MHGKHSDGEYVPTWLILMEHYRLCTSLSRNITVDIVENRFSETAFRRLIMILEARIEWKTLCCLWDLSVNIKNKKLGFGEATWIRGTHTIKIAEYEFLKDEQAKWCQMLEANNLEVKTHMVHLYVNDRACEGDTCVLHILFHCLASPKVKDNNAQNKTAKYMKPRRISTSYRLCRAHLLSRYSVWTTGVEPYFPA